MGLFSGGGDQALERRVTELEREVRELRLQLAGLTGASAGYPTAGYPTGGYPTDAPAPSGVYEPSAQVLSHLAGGKVINAIKVVREETGWGLKEAKDYVDRLRG